MSLPNNKIFLPVNAKPYVITNDLNEFKSVIGCENTSRTTIGYLDHFDYRLSIFFDESFSNKELLHNILASMLVKEKGPFYGNCILIDDHKDLSLDDLNKIIKIASCIPSFDWIPEPDIQFILNSKVRDKHDKARRQYIEKYVKKNPQAQRLATWDKIKEFYVEEDDCDDSHCTECAKHKHK